jgi:hypothetical protein
MARQKKTHDPFRWFDSSPEVIRLVVMMYVGGVKANVAEAHISGAPPPRLPWCFSKKRWLLPENRGQRPGEARRHYFALTTP